VSQDEPAFEVRTFRQFSLRGLLWFVVLTSLWCSQTAVVRNGVMENAGFLTASSLTSVVLAWVVLSWFCYRQRFFIVFVFQCVLPASVGVMGISTALSGSEDSILRSFGPFLFVALGTNLIWFPIMAVIMAIRWAWPSVVAKRRDRAMPWWP
jgi:hypothetical protein